MRNASSSAKKTKFQKLQYHLKRWTDVARVSFARIFLPRNVYAQSLADGIWHLGKFQDYFSDGKLFQRRQRFQWDLARWISLNQLLEIVETLPEGDYAELGTHRGDTASILFKRMPPGARLVCFDTFEGFDQKDLEKEQLETGVRSRAGHFSNTNIPLVRKRVTGSASPNDRLILAKGFFPDTFAGFEESKWRFVHLDADLYAPIKAGLDAFWPRLAPGGVLVVHDYNSTYLGAKKATDEFFSPLGITPVPLPDKVGSVVVIKPMTQIEKPS